MALGRLLADGPWFPKRVVYGWPVVVYGWPVVKKRVVYGWPVVVYGWPVVVYGRLVAVYGWPVAVYGWPVVLETGGLRTSCGRLRMDLRMARGRLRVAQPVHVRGFYSWCNRAANTGLLSCLLLYNNWFPTTITVASTVSNCESADHPIVAVH